MCVVLIFSLFFVVMVCFELGVEVGFFGVVICIGVLWGIIVVVF